jgi:hypothetical protein
VTPPPDDSKLPEVLNAIALKLAEPTLSLLLLAPSTDKPDKLDKLSERLRVLAARLDEASLSLRMIARRLEHNAALPDDEPTSPATPATRKSGEWRLGKP